MLIDRAVLYDFELAGRRVRLWKRVGESYEHVLMKALGYAMFVGEFPQLEIEREVGLRYKPDIVARRTTTAGGADERFLFWGECGANSIRKTAWLLKHGRVERLVLFKIERNTNQLRAQLRQEIPARYRQRERLRLVNFRADIVALTETRRIAQVPDDWYTETIV